MTETAAFQVTPPVVRDIGNGHEIDVDFLQGLKIYLDRFDRLTLACPVRTGDMVGAGLQRCVPLTELPFEPGRFTFIPLPLTFNAIDYLRAIPRIRPILAAEVAKATHLIFTPYGLIGDWPTIAIREAIRQHRRYVVEADAVHEDVARKLFLSAVPWKRAVQEHVLLPLSGMSHRHSLRHSTLGIFQGQSVYDAYAPHCPRAEKLNHHIPIYEGDHITPEALDAKLARIRDGAPLRIAYAGRVIDIKGPMAWLDVLHRLHQAGVRFEATWLGDGPLLEPMRARVAELGLPGVTLAGFVADHDTMLRAVRPADIFLFCHTTQESARVLGEALACGAPLVGFESSYPRDLVKAQGGGLFCPVGDTAALAALVLGLDQDRESLAQLVGDAARTGAQFDRARALAERVGMVMATPAVG